jgi:hypothetical protein
MNRIRPSAGTSISEKGHPGRRSAQSMMLCGWPHVILNLFLFFSS